MQRQRVDEALIWQLMRFLDEPNVRLSRPFDDQRRTTGVPEGVPVAH
jgi:hypothetical protein